MSKSLFILFYLEMVWVEKGKSPMEQSVWIFVNGIYDICFDYAGVSLFCFLPDSVTCVWIPKAVRYLSSSLLRCD